MPDKQKPQPHIQRKQHIDGDFFAPQPHNQFFGNGKTGQFFGAKPAIIQQKEEREYGQNTEDTSATNNEIVQKHGDDADVHGAPVPPASGTNTAIPPAANAAAPSGETCSPEADTAKRAFLASTYGPRSVVPPLDGGTAGYGGFEAQYIPSSNTLNITVRGKIQFIDALTGTGMGISSAASDYAAIANIIRTVPPDAQAELLAYFQWSATAKTTALAQFRRQLAQAIDIWQNTGMFFQVNETCWDDVKAYPKFSLEVTEEGTATYDTTTTAGTTTVNPTSDHLQVKIFKSPTDAERGAINAKIQELEQQGKIPCFANNSPNMELRAYVDGDRANAGSYGNADAHDNDMYLSSNDLDNMRSDERGGNNMLRYTIYFDRDSAVVTSSYTSGISQFLERFKTSGDSNGENNAINLIGFASAEGSTDYNTALVDRRIQAVRSIVDGFGVRVGQETKENVHDAVDGLLGDGLADIIGGAAGDRAERDVTGRVRTDNRSDDEAEANTAFDPAGERRVELRIGSGERQNTLAHEFGHIFGLADEYTEGDRGAGKEARHSQMARDAGVNTGAQTENSDNIISMGNTVRPQHYAPFANALNQLTGKTWHVKP